MKENTEAARLPSFNFLEEFAKYMTKEPPHATDQVVPLKVIRTMPIEPIGPMPVPAQVKPSDITATSPSDLDLNQLAELVKLIFKKVQANEQSIASEEEISTIMNHKNISLIEKVVLATYLKKNKE